MRKVNIIATMSLAGVIAFSSCKEKENVVPSTTTQTETTKHFHLDIKGLENLGDSYKYEGWLIVNGAPVSAGIFSVDANGLMSQTEFELDATEVESATAYVLTIEPSPDNDPKPSSVHILAGDFNGSSASLNTAHKSALGTDFTSATGNYILATPTDGGMMDNEQSGIWWLDPTTGPGAGLTLPTLPNGWKYEGWVVINGQPVSTGTFTAATGADDAALFSGTAAGPAFPGEDFLMNAPAGLTFPLDLSGGKAVISVEPSPDNSANPFLLKPLVGDIPMSAATHSALTMNNNATATNPTGTASR